MLKNLAFHGFGSVLRHINSPAFSSGWKSAWSRVLDYQFVVPCILLVNLFVSLRARRTLQ